MKAIKSIALFTILLVYSVHYCEGKTLSDSIQVIINFKDSSFLSSVPQLALQKLGGKTRVFLDPSSVKNDQIVFKFKKDIFFESALFLSKTGRPHLFFISPESTTITIRYEGVPTPFITKVEGSKAESDYRRFNSKEQENLYRISEIQRLKYKDYDENIKRPDVANERYLLFSDAQYSLFVDAVKDTSYYAPVIYWKIRQYFDHLKVNQIKELLATTDPGEAIYYYKLIEDDLKIKEQALNSESSRKILFGNIDLEKAVKNSAKKYIYLSFWASWCGPCRSHNKQLQGIKKDVEIIGVSLDENSSDMQKAITADSIQQWKHVQLKDGFNSKITKAFGIQGIPGNILLNEKREVIGVNISDQEFAFLFSR